MKGYNQRVHKKLVELSPSQGSIKEMVRLWEYKGICMDHGEPTETCELCGKVGLRHTYMIITSNGNALWVGSRCILQFEIKREGKENAKEICSELMKDRRIASRERHKKVLSDFLHTVLNQDKAASLTTWYEEKNGFTPKQAAWICSVSTNRGIAVPEFKILLRRDYHKNSLRLMEPERRLMVLGHLTSTQKSKQEKWEIVREQQEKWDRECEEVCMQEPCQ